MKKFVVAILISSTACGIMSAQNQSGTNAINNADNKQEIPEVVQMLQVAGQLTKYGYAQQEALPLIQAIDIYQSMAGGNMEESNKTESNATEDTTTKTSTITYDITQLTTDAIKFADGDSALLALIDELKNSATRGATKNYATHYDSVRAGGTDSYTIRFRGNEQACVIVSGDGDTDLDLYVYDANNNLITSDTDYTDDCVCVWTPAWTGNFIIKIVNRGRVYNRYALSVN